VKKPTVHVAAVTGRDGAYLHSSFPSFPSLPAMYSLLPSIFPARPPSPLLFYSSQIIPNDLSLSTLSRARSLSLSLSLSHSHTHYLSLLHTRTRNRIEYNSTSNLPTSLRSVLYMHMSLPLSCATPHRQKKLADEMKAAGPMLGGDSKVGVTLTE
jgi:hypothetical protein